MKDRITPELSIRGVRQLLAADDSPGGQALEFLDNLIGALLVLSPAIAGPVALPLLALIEPKNELFANVRYTLKKLGRRDISDFSARTTRLAAANCLITFSAYFDALSVQMPTLMSDIKLSEKEKQRISRSAITKAADPEVMGVAQSGSEETSPFGNFADISISVQHPAETTEENTTFRVALYEHMSEATLNFIRGLSTWDRLDETERRRIAAFFSNELVVFAHRAYDSQRMTLAMDFPDFFVWTMFKELGRVDEGREGLSEALNEQRKLVEKASTQIDIGLRNLAAAIAAIPRQPAQPSQYEAIRVSESLHKCYEAQVGLRVIEDSYSLAEAELATITYPEKLKAFVPQAYKVVRYIRKANPALHREETWDHLEAQNDLGPFLIRYLQTAYSTETPLLILGHPGSGKSLLTEIIAARLAYPAYTTVRVELRDIDPDADPMGQIEEQITKDTGRKVSWADVADVLSPNPPLVILDGYDELLQASGKVHADYLDRVVRFQHREAIQGRPIRIIVTSRLTLIDKASIPDGSTVMRLIDFDDRRQAKWIQMWNSENRTYFKDTDVQPFTLPSSPRVRSLAGQPLLLLMMAIYDSESNQLVSEEEIAQTVLYDSLLRRFILRERSKGHDGIEFNSLSLADRNKLVDLDMARLGVAAIGMFNRQAVYIRQTELNEDISYFRLKQDNSTSSGTRLSQADLLLGSFFFIHESRSRSTQAGLATSASGVAAFEFLHNTFGEFLTADFILKRVLAEADVVKALGASDVLRPALRERLVSMSEEWYACLIYSTLDSRPAVLRMLREWSEYRLGSGESGARREVLSSLSEIIKTQLREALQSYNPIDFHPGSKEDRSESPYKPLPMLGHLAVYSLNLIVLYAVISGEEYILDEKALRAESDACRPWDRLLAMWHSWLSLKDLAVAAEAISIVRDGSKIIVSYVAENASDSSSPSADGGMDIAREGKLNYVFRIAVGLGDTTTASLAGIGVAELSRISPETFDWIRKVSHEEGFDFSHYLDLGRLKNAPNIDDTSTLASRIANSPSIEDPERLMPYDAEILRLIGSRRTPANSGLWVINPMTAEALSRIHSRYEAEAIISGCTVIEPRWLAAVFRRLGEQRGYLLDILNSPSGAPLLRQACETLPRRTIIDISARIRKECQHRDASVFDAETACLVVGIGNRASHARTCKIGLESLIRVISQSDKLLLDMVPTQILAECADGVVRYQKDLASSRAVFADLARARVGTFFRRQPGMIAHTWVRIEALIQFWRMGLPFEGEAKHFFEREAHRAFSMVMPYPNRAFDDLVLAIVRYARESDSDEVLRIFESGWRQGGRRSASSSHEDFSSAAEFFEILRRDERDLSPSQQSDLRWIIRKRDSARVSAPEGSKAD